MMMFHIDPAYLVKMYTKTDEAIKEGAEMKAERRAVLAHTLIISFILNAGVGILFLDPIFTPLYTVMLTALTVVAIPAIEYATFLAAGSRGDFWKQLNITNHYLTPIFFLFFLVLAVLSWFLPADFKIGLDAIAFVVILYMNSKKIKAVHKIEKTIVPTGIYALTTAIAYMFWLLLLIAPLVLLGIPF